MESGNREAQAPLVPSAQPIATGMMQPQGQVYMQPQSYQGVPGQPNMMQQGYSAPQQSYPGPQAAYPGSQGAYPGPQGAYPGPQGAYPGPQGAYPGPQLVYPGQPGYPATPVVMWTNTSQVTTCRFCNTTGPTQVRYEAGAVTWLSCLGICLLGGGLGCCLIPFCVEPLQDCIHSCPRCGQMLGRKALV